MMNMPANSTTSNQYLLLTHLYEYFGALLGCSQYGQGAFPAYSGHASMYSVHKFMDLDIYEVSYFVEQVGLSAASFGVATADVDAVGKALMSLFGYKCAPPTIVIPAQGSQLESICIADDCPLAPNSTCSSYATVSSPAAAAANNTYMGNATSASNGSVTMSSSPAMATTNGAAGLVVEAAMGFLGVAAIALAL